MSLPIIGLLLLLGAGSTAAIAMSKQRKAKRKPSAPSTPTMPGQYTGQRDVHRVATGIREFVRFMQPLDVIAQSKGFKKGLITAHAAQENGSGKSVIGHNLWNVKAGQNWLKAGKPYHAVMTTEYVAGKPVKMVQKFKKFASYGEAVKNFIQLMQWSNYAYAWANRDNPREFFRGLVGKAQGGKATYGYATQPNYDENCMRTYNTVKQYV